MSHSVIFAKRYRERVILRRNRIFRDRSNPFDVFDDGEMLNKFRFRRMDIVAITDSIKDEIDLSNRLGSLTPLLQVLITLRFYASGNFQDSCGDMIGVKQSTVSRTISRVTKALLPQFQQLVRLPTQQQADETKEKIFRHSGFPNVIGCIDGVQIRIQAPSEFEHEYVNRKNYHSINVQVMCDADLMFTNCIAKWPGSVSDSRILQNSSLFTAFENDASKPLHGFILGDGDYLLRDWLLTPVPSPGTLRERTYNSCHRSALSAVDRAVGELKQRWHCLRKLRSQPTKACQVICVCVMLHNRARSLNLVVPSDQDGGSDGENEAESPESDPDSKTPQPVNSKMSEQIRTAAGKAVQDKLMDNYFSEVLILSWSSHTPTTFFTMAVADMKFEIEDSTTIEMEDSFCVMDEADGEIPQESDVEISHSLERAEEESGDEDNSMPYAQVAQ